MLNQTGKKPVRFTSFDMDGSLLKRQIQTHQQLVEDNTSFLAALVLQGQCAFQATFAMIFSNRQSQSIDDLNRKRYNNHHLTIATDPTSCFLSIQKIARHTLKATFSPLLLADAYYDRADGYSLSRAITRADDADAYHPGFVFDANKTSIVYAQAHTAANIVRDCDFLVYESEQENIDWSQIHFKSNAAFIVVKGNQQHRLFYRNNIEKIQEELKVNAEHENDLDELIKELQRRIDNEDHDFEMRSDEFAGIDGEMKAGHEAVVITKGITLSDQQLQTMSDISGRLHQKVDYPIFFDAYDDLADILKIVHDTYNASSALRRLLPRNVIVRLHQYPASDVSRCLYTIVGAGPIDLKPKETVVRMGQRLLPLVRNLFDYPENVAFEEHIAGFEQSFWQQRQTVTPQQYQPLPAHYAPFADYSSLFVQYHRQIVEIWDKISSLLRPLPPPAPLFKNHRLSKMFQWFQKTPVVVTRDNTQQLRTIKQLLKDLKNVNSLAIAKPKLDELQQKIEALDISQAKINALHDRLTQLTQQLIDRYLQIDPTASFNNAAAAEHKH